MNIKNSMLETIGNTPLVKLNKLCKNSNIYLKLESFNPTGSIKVRPALRILADAEINGVLKKDSTIIESSSGNFGIALSMIGAIKCIEL
jgi:cysteine synthase